MADCLDLTIDDIVFECELGACTEDVDLGWWTAAQGSVGGSLAKFKGMSKRRAEDRGAPRMADDAEDRAEMEGPGLLHHHHRG